MIPYPTYPADKRSRTNGDEVLAFSVLVMLAMLKERSSAQAICLPWRPTQAHAKGHETHLQLISATCLSWRWNALDTIFLEGGCVGWGWVGLRLGWREVIWVVFNMHWMVAKYGLGG